MNTEIKNKHLKSKSHKPSLNSTVRKYITPNPLPGKIEDTIRKYSKIHFDEYNKFRIVLLLKLLLRSNQIKYITIQRSSYCYKSGLPNAFFLSKIKIIKEQLYSQTLELRITFVSRFEIIRLEFYLTKPKSTQWKLLAMLD